MPLSLNVFNPNDFGKAEALARIAGVFIVTLSLAVADIPGAVPPSVSFLVGVIGGSMAVSLPYYMSTIFSSFPLATQAMVYSLAVQSLLLAAATVSNELLVVVFAIHVFWCTSLYFGSTYKSLSGMAGLAAAVPGLLTLSFRGLVQNGVSVTIDEAEAASGVTLLRNILTTLCESQGEAADCWIDQLPSLDGHKIVITLPESAGNFAGQTAYITPDTADGSINVHIPGGLWVVKGLWTWSGTTNGLANNQNFLIAVAWALVVMAIFVALPPFRTTRRAIAHSAVPMAIKEAVTVLKENENTPVVGSKFLNYITNGSCVLIIFEPRLFRAPFEYTVPQMEKLIAATDDIILMSQAYFIWRQAFNLGQPYWDILMECADALTTYDNESMRRLKQQKTDMKAENRISDNVTSYDQRVALALLDATMEWLDCQLNRRSPSPCTKDSFANIKNTYLVWLFVPMTMIFRLLQALLIPLRPRQWSFRSFVWASKFAIGLISLFVMAVYWENFSNFAIQTSANAEVGPVYVGWHLVSFVFAYTITFEGTVKKGLQRLLGTCYGGFMAWLAIIVCSGSYDDNAKVNPYGLVAWLTVTNILFVSLVVESNFISRAARPDRFYTMMYFITTQNLIALEVYSGKGTKNDLVVNRAVSTCTGVLMAMLVASLPPLVRAGDKERFSIYLSGLTGTFRQLLEVLANGEISSRESEKVEKLKKSLTDLSNIRSQLVFLMKDADQFHRLPLFRVDEKLKSLLEEITISEALVWQMFTMLFSYDGDEEALGQSFAEGSECRAAAQEALVDIMTGEEKEVVGRDNKKPQNQPPPGFPTLIRYIYVRLKEHKEKLGTGKLSK